jgi:hypothetical protein
MSLGFPTGIGADAHSGATVTDFNRVPISISQSINETSGPAAKLFPFQRAILYSSTTPLSALQAKNKNF